MHLSEAAIPPNPQSWVFYSWLLEPWLTASRWRFEIRLISWLEGLDFFLKYLDIFRLRLFCLFSVPKGSMGMVVHLPFLWILYGEMFNLRLPRFEGDLSWWVPPFKPWVSETARKGWCSSIVSVHWKIAIIEPAIVWKVCFKILLRGSGYLDLV